jgi:hypothetical protein
VRVRAGRQHVAFRTGKILKTQIPFLDNLVIGF